MDYGGQGASTAEEVEEAVAKNARNSQPELWWDFSKMMGGGDDENEVLLHNVDAHNINVTGRVCYLT